MRLSWNLVLLAAGFYLLPGIAPAADPSCGVVHAITAAYGIHHAGYPSADFTRVVSPRREGTIVTEAEAAYSIDETGELSVELRYPAKEGMVSLPFQYFAVELKLGGATEFFYDLTGGCAGPGAAIYPGERLLLPRKKLSDSIARACERGCSVVLRVWGYQ